MSINYQKSYSDLVHNLLRGLSTDEAMSQAVGGNSFIAFGVLLRQVLIQAGLSPDHFLVDVGCGSGRLSYALSTYLRGPYLGTDVVPEMLDYARRLCRRSDWRFEAVSDIAIPAADGAADMVCFFSVFTHLLHEDTYRYLREAHRVLKPEGKVVFSFLEFSLPEAWTVFEDKVAARDKNYPGVHNQFMDREAIDRWAAHLGFSILGINQGDKPHIDLPQPLMLEDGSAYEHRRCLGQSVCVLRKPN
jgi:SAM-dependent methyltransferase